VTTDVDEAAIYAGLAPGGGCGDVYEVEPLGELEPDPGGAVGVRSYAARGATVVAVVRRAVSREEAVTRMLAVLGRLEVDVAERSFVPAPFIDGVPIRLSACLRMCCRDSCCAQTSGSTSRSGEGATVESSGSSD
jgi:hypothetical protein